MIDYTKTDFSMTGAIANHSGPGRGTPAAAPTQGGTRWGARAPDGTPVPEPPSDLAPGPGLIRTDADGKELPPGEWFDPELKQVFRASEGVEHIANARNVMRNSLRSIAEGVALTESNRARRTADESYRRWCEAAPVERPLDDPIARIEALEARCAALEAKLERLTAPTRLASRPKARPSRATQEGGDLPPAA